MRIFACLMLALLMVAGCSEPKKMVPASETPNLITTDMAPLENGEPAYITVQHILIGFSGSVPGKPIKRTKAEAEQFSGEVLEKAQAGESFDELVKEHTNDSPPGIYKMANFGKPGDMTSRDQSKWVFERDGMVPAFGNVGFILEVGEIGMSDFDEAASPYGWHIIKRIK